MINQLAVSTTSHNNIINYPNPQKKPQYRLQLVSAASPMRSRVEDFIQLSYHNHFSAHLSHFFPLILAVTKISDDSLMGALGVRYADETQLFSECYLPESIEEMILKHEQCKEKTVNRRKIIELGNFVIRKTTDIKTVIPFIGQFIKSLDVEWTVYTLTRPIKSHFDRLGISLNLLKEADISAVNGAASSWGNYYKFKPAVYFSSVKNNMNQE